VKPGEAVDARDGDRDLLLERGDLGLDHLQFGGGHDHGIVALGPFSRQLRLAQIAFGPRPIEPGPGQRHLALDLGILDDREAAACRHRFAGTKVEAEQHAIRRRANRLNRAGDGGGVDFEPHEVGVDQGAGIEERAAAGGRPDQAHSGAAH
jgi:hypothetical protein